MECHAFFDFINEIVIDILICFTKHSFVIEDVYSWFYLPYSACSFPFELQPSKSEWIEASEEEDEDEDEDDSEDEDCNSGSNSDETDDDDDVEVSLFHRLARIPVLLCN